MSAVLSDHPAGESLQSLFGRRPRLLVVDDQPANVQALYQVFAADHQVFMATGGEQALQICATRQPDLVLLDVVMAGLDGLEVCTRLKADEATRDIPVIFVTAQSDAASEEHGLDVGAVDFISKPINPKIVRARVRTHLTLKRQSDLLREWVYVDGLTNVCNRRFFEERLAAEWARAVRQDAPLSVVMIDVDYFKRYNDHHGHPAGDACLRRLAAEFKACLKRPTDLVARYGGEEFVCLLPDTDLAGALNLAGQIGERVRAAAIPHERSAIGPVVTVSLGVGCRPSGVMADARGLLVLADEQLYRAKAQGRDQVCGAVLATP
jgi:diguanylate cyclase (GGDEF)-like protein